MALRPVNGPVTKAQQLLALGGLMMDQIMAHGLKTKMIQVSNTTPLHLLLVKMTAQSSMKMVS